MSRYFGMNHWRDCYTIQDACQWAKRREKTGGWTMSNHGLVLKYLVSCETLVFILSTRSICKKIGPVWFFQLVERDSDKWVCNSLTQHLIKPSTYSFSKYISFKILFIFFVYNIHLNWIKNNNVFYNWIFAQCLHILQW